MIYRYKTVHITQHIQIQISTADFCFIYVSVLGEWLKMQKQSKMQWHSCNRNCYNRLSLHLNRTCSKLSAYLLTLPSPILFFALRNR